MIPMIGSVLYLPRFFCPPANLVFHQTVERIHVGKKFGDIPRGIFIVRGENVVLLGEIVSRHNLVFTLVFEMVRRMQSKAH